MRVLWRQPTQHLTVREVKDALAGDLAYTTVMTMLTRLHRKGFLDRRRDGRAWAYRPVVTQGEHAATAMTAALHGSDDHAAALFHFVEQLSADEQAELRRRLEEDTGH